MSHRRQYGFVSFGSMTLIVGGCALAGLLVYGWTSGQALPVWPALAVVAVNLYAAWRLFAEARARRAAQSGAEQAAPPASTPGGKRPKGKK